tara:strand:+ start:280 stop:606 length:327 start_codon:yes stop_codon:yes gene_type:complete
MIEKTPEEIKDILESDEKVVILDVREDWEYEICHLDNSLHIPMLQVEDKVETLNKDDTHIMVCHHGIRSRMIGKYLESVGFKNILNLSSGLEGWATDVDHTMKKYERK